MPSVSREPSRIVGEPRRPGQEFRKENTSRAGGNPVPIIALVINRSLGASVRAYLAGVLGMVICVAVLWRIPAITAAAAAPVLLLIVLLIARALGTGPAL